MKILALSPHTDDIELGCGGYLSKMSERGHSIYTVSFSHIYNGQNLSDEHRLSMAVLRTAHSEILSFETRRFDRQLVLDAMLIYKEHIKPDIVLCPSLTDVHQDHVVVAQEAVRAFSKDTTLLCYDLPWNCRGFNGNYFVSLSKRHVEHKLQMMACYKSQAGRAYFDAEFIEGLARVRGQQIKIKYAESFEIITWIS